MGGAARTVGRVGSGIFTLGGSEIARNNLSRNNLLNKALQTPGMILTGGQSGGWSNGDRMQGDGTSSNPFSIDPAQVAADQEAIAGLANSQGNALGDLGRSQYGQANAFIAGDQASRDAARQRLSDALINQNQSTFKQGMAGTLEDLNARHLANGSGVGQEFARQQGDIATNIANEIGTAGARDYTTASDQRGQALQGLLGAQSGALATKQAGGTNALSRGFSLNDFIMQANVAKSIGATAAPQVPSGKASGLSGGLGGAAAGAPFGPGAAGIGGIAGLLLGSQANKQGK